MNDLRLPGLNAPLGPAARTDAGGARDTARGSDFDAALLRSVQADAPPARSAERAADAAAARRRAVEPSARGPRDDERTARAPSRPAEPAPERNTPTPPDRDDVDAARSAARAAPAQPVAGSARDDASPAAAIADEADRGAQDAAPGDAVAAEHPAIDPTAVPGVAVNVAPAMAQRTGPMTIAAADGGAPADTVPADAADALAAPAPAAPADGRPAFAAPLSTPGKAAQAEPAAPADGRPAFAAPLSTPGKAAQAEAAAPAEAVRAPVKDRLIEDFERRYENALGRAAGAAGTSPLYGAAAPAGPGLPPGLTPAAPSMTVAYASVTAPIGHPAFGQDLSHRILLFAGQHVHSAEIAVTPADLGPIRVAIEVRGQEAALQFSAAHATTRAAIEDALPRLREMLAAQGLQLTQADVGDRSQRGAAFGQRSDGRNAGEAGGRDAVRPGALGAGGAEAANVRRIGLIDIRV